MVVVVVSMVVIVESSLDDLVLVELLVTIGFDVVMGFEVVTEDVVPL